ncbi:MAG TPA: flagellar motor protein MotA, partial [Rhodospirillaceae bacterium]|nr:flagellar motor protein MotA [Rhodospirillaceae bacterium]
MGIFLIIIAIGVFLIYPTLADAFLANAVINGVILGVLVIGIVHAFRTVVGLYAETNWIQRFRLSFENGYQHTEAAPRLMAS